MSGTFKSPSCIMSSCGPPPPLRSSRIPAYINLYHALGVTMKYSLTDYISVISYVYYNIFDYVGDTMLYLIEKAMGKIRKAREW
jgi:hypothetical protein